MLLFFQRNVKNIRDIMWNNWTVVNQWSKDKVCVCVCLSHHWLMNCPAPTPQREFKSEGPTSWSFHLFQEHKKKKRRSVDNVSVFCQCCIAFLQNKKSCSKMREAAPRSTGDAMLVTCLTRVRQTDSSSLMFLEVTFHRPQEKVRLHHDTNWSWMMIRQDEELKPPEKSPECPKDDSKQNS